MVSPFDRFDRFPAGGGGAGGGPRRVRPLLRWRFLLLLDMMHY